MREDVKRKIKEHIWGPTGSVILHIVVIFIAVNFITFAVRETASEVEVMMMEPESVDIEELEELEREIEEVELPEVEVDVNVETEAPTPDEMTEFQSDQPDVDFDALNVMDNVKSPLVMKGLFSGRSASGRASSLRQYGGKWAEASERAVIKALEWLKRNQKPDGRWEKEDISMTGLAVLTFLAHGETPGSEKYGETVEKGIRYLVDNQKPGGQFGDPSKRIFPYYHAIATYAIAEAYGLTRIPKLRESMEKGIDVIIQGQQPGGGFNYHYDNKDRRDTSVAGWQVQAMKAAYLAGAENDGLKDAMAKAIADMESAYYPKLGTFGYTDPRGKDMAMTGVATLSLQFLGRGRSQEVDSAIQALDEVECKWDDATKGGLYAWYYITQAKFHRGGGTWRSWNNEFARTITTEQEEDGHWKFPTESDGDTEHGAHYGPVYSTTLAALMLQVYYRHLPTFKEEASEEREEETAEDDVVIEII